MTMAVLMNRHQNIAMSASATYAPMKAHVSHFARHTPVYNTTKFDVRRNIYTCDAITYFEL